MAARWAGLLEALRTERQATAEQDRARGGRPGGPQVVAGQTAAVALKKVKRGAVRKGMVLVDERLKPAAAWEFDAEIAILTHSTTIAPKYQVGCLLGSGAVQSIKDAARGPQAARASRKFDCHSLCWPPALPCAAKL